MITRNIILKTSPSLAFLLILFFSSFWAAAEELADVVATEQTFVDAEFESDASVDVQNAEFISPEFADEIFGTELGLAGEIVAAPQQKNLPDPTYIIEEISISGNSVTLKSYIRRNFSLRKGQHINLVLLENARLELLSTGLFDSVEIKLRAGSQKSYIKLELQLRERNYVWVEDIFIGSSKKSKYWHGFDLAYNNMLGVGHRLRMGFVANVINDYALEISYAAPNIVNSGFSLSGDFFTKRSHEDIYEKPPSSRDLEHLSLVYERLGGRLTLGYGYKFFKLRFSLFAERLRFDSSRFIHKTNFRAGTSLHSGLALILGYDSTDHVFIPRSGFLFQLELSGALKRVLSDYSYFKVQVSHQSNFSFSQDHTLRLHIFGGIIAPDAPFFEYFFIGDYYDFLPSRVLGINMTNSPALDIFGTGAANENYENLLIKLSFEYAYRFKLKTAELKAMEVFFQVTALSSISLEDDSFWVGLKPRDTETWGFPINASLNFGLRFATSFGNFSLSLAKVFPLAYR
ncbi:MAG: BamA/TamA family outer membrane protein [Bradymonadales bacterium]|jgi:outer membrane protein insertion porin family